MEDNNRFEPSNFEFANPDTDLLMLKQIALANTEPNKHTAIKEAFYRVQMKLEEKERIGKERNQMRYALSIIKEKGVDIDCVEQSKDYDDFVVMCRTYGYKRIPTKDEYEVLTNYF